MALSGASLKSGLEALFRQRPDSAAQAADTWANAYGSYAGGAMTSAGSLATNAAASFGILSGAFNSALQARSPAGAAALMGQGVMAFWQAIVWASPGGFVGATTVPGNFSLIAALTGIFADLQEKSEADQAGELADAFDAGARMVMVTDIHAVSGVTVVGPIN